MGGRGAEKTTGGGAGDRGAGWRAVAQGPELHVSVCVCVCVCA